MDQSTTYGKIMDMVTEGMERVHKTYMTEMDKVEPDKIVEVAKDYAVAMMGFATLMTATAMLKPYTPWANLVAGCPNQC